MSVIEVPSRHMMGIDHHPLFWAHHPYLARRLRAFAGLGVYYGDTGGDPNVDPFSQPPPDYSPPPDYVPPYGDIGSTFGCAPGYEVGDAAGNCVPAGSGGGIPPGSTVHVGTEGLDAAKIAALLAPLAAQGLKIIQSNSLPPGSLVLPNGTVIHQTPGYPVSGTGINFGGATALFTPTTLLIIAAAAVAVVLLKDR